ncbi:SRPBCC family protein [Roseivirga sp. 4D4]|uniref:SRPBCC family protein n=1 Tax=Roseivirga sp. 4D4 TaxID=1889784 RepID=UPI00147BF346|nr:SRPBCC domain-containing protein [Roseivirga sp. 4D4]
MKRIIPLILILTSCLQLSGQTTNDSRVKSWVDSSYANELVLIQEFEVNVPLEKVWDTYTTKEGWESAFVALAEVDFKVNGTIKTSYNQDATIGDSSTIVLHIVNYVPKKLLTLQAEITQNFPDFMKADEKDLFNIISLEELKPSLTKVTSYGIGYKNNPKYQSLMKFFIEGNELSYNNLILFLETGKKAKY